MKSRKKTWRPIRLAYLYAIVAMSGCTPLKSPLSPTSHNSSSTLATSSFDGSVTPLTPNDFPNYQASFGSGADIFYWRNENNEYYCGIKGASSNGFLPEKLLLEMTEVNPCPIKVASQIINEYRNTYPDITEYKNNIYEISYPLGDLEFDDAASSYPGAPTRNTEVYSILGLDECYEKRYGESEAIYFKHHNDAFKVVNSPAVKIHAKHFTNLAHIYRWKDGQGIDRYGLGPQYNDESPTTYERIAFMQNKCSCTKEEIKTIIEAYYGDTNASPKNKIINVPKTSDYTAFTWPIATNTINDYVSDDVNLYMDLGIEGAYHSNFN